MEPNSPSSKVPLCFLFAISARKNLLNLSDPQLFQNKYLHCMIIEKKVKGERQHSRHSAWAMGSSVGSSSVLGHWLYLLLVITLAVTEGNVWTSHIFLASSAQTATQWLCFLSVPGRKRTRPTLGYRGPCTSVLPPEAVSPWTLGGKVSFFPLELSSFCSGPCEADV